MIKENEIEMHCACGSKHIVKRDPDVDKDAIRIDVNWCPICMDNADDYYEEIHIYEESDEEDKVDDNQINLGL